MQQYLDLLQKIRKKGVRKPTRTISLNTHKRLDAYAIFGHQMRFDLQDGFPMVTTKAIPFKLIAGEILWMLSGNTNIQPLLKMNNHIWSEWPYQEYKLRTGLDIALDEFEKRVLEDDEFAIKWGDLGPVYGKQWRDWQGSSSKVDQIAELLKNIEAVKLDPRSSVGRRLIVSAWNVALVKQMAIPPCHTLFQFDVTDGHLSCHLFQRSADVFLGVPFNIAGYALLIHLIARETDLIPGEFVHTLSDVHIYENHIEQVDLQLQRTPKSLPRLVIAEDAPGLFEIGLQHLRLVGYNPDEMIVGEIAV